VQGDMWSFVQDKLEEIRVNLGMPDYDLSEACLCLSLKITAAEPLPSSVFSVLCDVLLDTRFQGSDEAVSFLLAIDLDMLELMSHSQRKQLGTVLERAVPCLTESAGVLLGTEIMVKCDSCEESLRRIGKWLHIISKEWRLSLLPDGLLFLYRRCHSPSVDRRAVELLNHLRLDYPKRIANEAVLCLAKLGRLHQSRDL
jgi:hypothetical protein